MSAKLIGLVQADPELMIYALEHLGEEAPGNAPNTFYRDMLRGIEQRIGAQLLPLLISDDPARRLTPEQIARLEKLWGQRADETVQLTRIAHTLEGADIPALRGRLHDPNARVRKVAIQIVARKRSPLEGELIDLLVDPKVWSTAHDALVRLARGTDFGPTPKMSKKDQLRCIAKWRHWLALQQTARGDIVAPREAPKGDVVPAAAGAKSRAK